MCVCVFMYVHANDIICQTDLLIQGGLWRLLGACGTCKFQRLSLSPAILLSLKLLSPVQRFHSASTLYSLFLVLLVFLPRVYSQHPSTSSLTTHRSPGGGGDGFLLVVPLPNIDGAWVGGDKNGAAQ